jgi:hypothetical protein
MTSTSRQRNTTLFDFAKFCEDNDIEYADEGVRHKRTRRGWLQTNCPRLSCGGSDYHLGFNKFGGYLNCYRCGAMSITEFIKDSLNIDWRKAKILEKEYGGADNRIFIPRKKKAFEKEIDVRLPPGTAKMKKQHLRYLRGRGFDPYELERTWDLKGTGHIGFYNFRIVAPVYYKKTLVSYQCRDITERSEFKYLTCKEEDERIHHKDIVYGHDLAKKRVIVVEGIADVWKLGPGSVALFGTGWTHEQVMFLKKYKKVFIFFDNEPEAIQRAHKLCFELNMIGVDAEVITMDIDGDPGSLSLEDSRYVMRELLIS